MECIFNEYLEFVETFLVNYYKLLLEKEYNKEIIKKFIDRYIEVRYYNKTELKEESFTEVLNKELNEVALELINEYPDYQNTIKNIFALFGYVIYIDGVAKYKTVNTLIKTLFSDTNIKLHYKEETQNKVANLIKDFIAKRDGFFKLFTDEEFYLKGRQLDQNIFFVDLGHNCDISKLYSEYAINKAYDSEVVLENRRYLSLVMLTAKILVELTSLEFDNNYIIDFPESLISKPRKIIRYLNAIDNELLIKKISINCRYCVYKNPKLKKTINTLINNGYNVSIELDDSYSGITQDLFLFKYVLVDSNNEFYEDLISKRDEIKSEIIIM